MGKISGPWRANFKMPGTGWYYLTLTLLSCTLLLGACGPNPTDTNQNTPTPSSSLKISSALLEIFITYTSTSGSADDKKNAAVQYAREKNILNSKDEAVFDLVINPADRQGAISDKVKAMGGRVANSADVGGEFHMQVAVPVDVMINYVNNANQDNFLNDLASFDGVKSINLVPSFPKQGFQNFPDSPAALQQLATDTKNEGVAIMGADKWQAAGFRGKGAKIGVIDEGFKYYQQFVGTTLPDSLVMKDMDADTGGDGVIDQDVHGTAVLEIVASLAPEAQIYAVGFDGDPIELKQSLDYLLSKNVNIVSGSFGYHDFSGDGNGPVAKMIETYRQKGMMFLFSSGNEGDSHYVDFFNPDSQGFHQFVPGVTRMLISNGGSTNFDTSLTLNWEQWDVTGQKTDLDFFLIDANDRVIDSSEDSQVARDPVEYMRDSLKPKTVYYLRVRLKNPDQAPPAKPFRLHVFTKDVSLQFSVPQMAVASPADSKAALAVGAIQQGEDQLAYYSSQGPAWDGRFKPEISAPTGVHSAAYQQDGEDVFDGTSASCPEAAGVAGILKGANPSLTGEQLEDLLQEATKDLSPAGPDYANGYGQLDIGKFSPSASIAPQGKPAAVPNADMTNLQFPVLQLKYYPTPKVSNPTMPKIGPTPLPTRGTDLSDGATDDSKIGGNPVANAGNATPQPTATASSNGAPSLPQPVSNVTFVDTFKNLTSGLPNTGNTVYQNGTYHVKTTGNQLTWGSYPSTVVNVGSNFAVEIAAQGITTKDGLYGLIFWQQDAQNYYLLSVTGTGQYEVSQFSGGQYKEIIGWNSAPGWKANAANLLRVTANNGQIAIFFNNQPGKTGQASGQGAIGFAAGSYGSGAEATYSGFRLTLSN